MFGWWRDKVFFLLNCFLLAALAPIDTICLLSSKDTTAQKECKHLLSEYTHYFHISNNCRQLFLLLLLFTQTVFVSMIWWLNCPSKKRWSVKTAGGQYQTSKGWVHCRRKVIVHCQGIFAKPIYPAFWWICPMMWVDLFLVFHMIDLASKLAAKLFLKSSLYIFGNFKTYLETLKHIWKL